jgi:N-acetyllactosaminide beta-1,3-N-acetylglucosaminyltransferase
MISLKMCNIFRCAFVIPTFELDKKQTYPKSKEEVVKFWKGGLARPFHFNVFKAGHNATNYSLYVIQIY